METRWTVRGYLYCFEVHLVPRLWETYVTLPGQSISRAATIIMKGTRDVYEAACYTVAKGIRNGLPGKASSINASDRSILRMTSFLKLRRRAG